MVSLQWHEVAERIAQSILVVGAGRTLECAGEPGTGQGYAGKSGYAAMPNWIETNGLKRLA